MIITWILLVLIIIVLVVINQNICEFMRYVEKRNKRP